MPLIEFGSLPKEPTPTGRDYVVFKMEKLVLVTMCIPHESKSLVLLVSHTLTNEYIDCVVFR